MYFPCRVRKIANDATVFFVGYIVACGAGMQFDLHQGLTLRADFWQPEGSNASVKRRDVVDGALAGHAQILVRVPDRVCRIENDGWFFCCNNFDSCLRR